MQHLTRVELVHVEGALLRRAREEPLEQALFDAEVRGFRSELEDLKRESVSIRELYEA